MKVLVTEKLNRVGLFKDDSLFTNLHFLNLWAAQGLTQVGVRLFDFVLAIQIFKVTGSNASVSYLILSYALPALLFSSIAGVLVDKWNKKGTLILINLLRGIVIVAFLLTTKTFSSILFFAFLLSLITQFFVPIEGSLIPMIVKKKHLLSANSVFTLTLYSSSVLGFMGAGPLIKTLGDRGAYVFVALMFFIATFLVVLLPNKDKKHLFGFFKKSNHINVFTIATQIKEGLKIVQSSQYIKKSIIFMAMSQIIVGMFMALMPGFAVSILGLAAEDSSLLLIGPASIGMVVGAIIVAKFGNGHSKSKIVSLGVFMSFVVFLLMSFLPEFNRNHMLDGFDFTFPIDESFMPVEVRRGIVLSATALTFVTGMFNSFIVIPSTTLLQEKTNSKNRGKIYGFLQTVITAGGAIPILFAGIFADYFGISYVLRIISIIILIMFIFSLSYNARNTK